MRSPRIVGVSEAWFPDGTPQRRRTADGSTPRLQEWYSNGALALEVDDTETREFPPHGVIVEYYPTGRMRSRVAYEHGVKHGKAAHQP